MDRSASESMLNSSGALLISLQLNLVGWTNLPRQHKCDKRLGLLSGPFVPAKATLYVSRFYP